MVKSLPKKTISISVDGKPLLKVYGNAEEIQTFFDSVHDSDGVMTTSFLEGDDTIEHNTNDIDMAHVSGGYETKLGKSFRDLQKSLATGEVTDAGDGFPNLTSLDSYQDRLCKSFRELHKSSLEAKCNDDANTETEEVDYLPLSPVLSYETKLGHQFQDLMMSICRKSSSSGDDELPPSPSSVADIFAEMDLPEQIHPINCGERPSSWDEISPHDPIRVTVGHRS